MAYGLKVLSSNGFIQFSTETPFVYSELARKTTTITGRGTDAEFTTATLSFASEIAANATSRTSDSAVDGDYVFAIRPTVENNGFEGYALPNGSNLKIYNTSNTTATVEAVCFFNAEKRTIPASGYGLTVLDDATPQNLIFTSEYGPLAVQTIITLNFNTGTGLFAGASYQNSDINTSGMAHNWVLCTAWMGTMLENDTSWEDDESGFGTGEAIYSYATCGWGNPSGNIAVSDDSYLETGITESTFNSELRAWVGVSNTAKFVVLRGYNYP